MDIWIVFERMEWFEIQNRLLWIELRPHSASMKIIFNARHNLNSFVRHAIKYCIFYTLSSLHWEKRAFDKHFLITTTKSLMQHDSQQQPKRKVFVRQIEVKLAISVRFMCAHTPPISFSTLTVLFYRQIVGKETYIWSSWNNCCWFLYK